MCSCRRISMVVMMGTMFSALAVNPADAQIVRVYRGGGIHIRAPFVRIDIPPVLPRTRLRPLAPAGTAGAGRGRALTADQSTASLEVALRRTALALQEELRRFQTADSWQRYLRLPPVYRSPGWSTRRDVATMKQLQSLARLFEEVAANSYYAMIAELPAFVATRDVLKAIITSRGEQSTPINRPAAEEIPLPDESPTIEDSSRPVTDRPAENEDARPHIAENDARAGQERSILKQPAGTTNR